MKKTREAKQAMAAAADPEQGKRVHAAINECALQLAVWFDMPQDVLRTLIGAIVRGDAPEVIASTFERWIDPEAWAKYLKDKQEAEAEEAAIQAGTWVRPLPLWQLPGGFEIEKRQRARLALIHEIGEAAEQAIADLMAEAEAEEVWLKELDEQVRAQRQEAAS